MEDSKKLKNEFLSKALKLKKNAGISPYSEMLFWKLLVIYKEIMEIKNKLE